MTSCNDLIISRGDINLSQHPLVNRFIAWSKSNKSFTPEIYLLKDKVKLIWINYPDSTLYVTLCKLVNMLSVTIPNILEFGKIHPNVISEDSLCCQLHYETFFLYCAFTVYWVISWQSTSTHNMYLSDFRFNRYSITEMKPNISPLYAAVFKNSRIFTQIEFFQCMLIVYCTAFQSEAIIMMQSIRIYNYFFDFVLDSIVYKNKPEEKENWKDDWEVAPSEPMQAVHAYVSHWFVHHLLVHWNVRVIHI